MLLLCFDNGSGRLLGRLGTLMSSYLGKESYLLDYMIRSSKDDLSEKLLALHRLQLLQQVGGRPAGFHDHAGMPRERRLDPADILFWNFFWEFMRPRRRAT